MKPMKLPVLCEAAFALDNTLIVVKCGEIRSWWGG